MTKLGSFWTGAIGYVSLGVGAGLSIMYNVLQTAAIRGPELAWPDIVTAVAMPGLVVLMVELFVSRLWIGRPWYVQAIRVAAVAGVGGVAMRASWTHGHAWLLAHGHTDDVAIAWPLAIDSLAILATALILAGRGQLASAGQLATATPASGWPIGQAVHGLANPGQLASWPGAPLASPEDVAMAGRSVVASVAAGDGQRPMSEDDLGQLAEDLDAFERGVEMAEIDAGQELAREAERLANGESPAAPVPVIAVPEAARELIQECLSSGDRAGDIDKLVAASQGVSERVARRWRTALRGA